MAGYSTDTFVSEIKNKVGNELMRTHKSYWPIIKKMIAGECVAALAHITGGGITENLPRVLAAGATILGINNRDLRTFETNLDHTLILIPKVPSDICVVSESGIRTRADMLRLEQAGVKAALIGETLMTAADIGGKLRELRGAS